MACYGRGNGMACHGKGVMYGMTWHVRGIV